MLEVVAVLPIGRFPTWDEKTQRRRPRSVEQVRVVIDPSLAEHGEERWNEADGGTIVLREWDLQVLVHEICHCLLPGGALRHGEIADIEVGLTPLIRQLAALDDELGNGGEGSGT